LFVEAASQQRTIGDTAQSVPTRTGLKICRLTNCATRICCVVVIGIVTAVESVNAVVGPAMRALQSIGRRTACPVCSHCESNASEFSGDVPEEWK
jgi:hypothetical protein